VGEDVFQAEAEILIDPRWEVSQEDLLRNYDVGNDIASLITKSQQQLLNLRKIEKQSKSLADRLQEEQKELSEAAKKIATESKKLQDLIYQDKIESSQDEINYPRKFTNHLIRLYRVVIGQNNRPSQGELERWQDLQVDYGSFNSEYDRFIREEVGSLLKQLKENDIPVISTK
jgi:DNA repair exonuclease SbcCD ATPase subunit